MSYFTDDGRDLLVAAWLAGAKWLSVHSAYPGPTGANELTGGGYARIDITTAVTHAPAAGQGVSDAAVSVATGAVTALWFGFWSDPTGGTFFAGSPLGGFLPEAGTFSGSTFTSPSHGLSIGSRVVLGDILVAGLPSGFTAGTAYYVVAAATDTFQLSATSGGAAISSSDTREVIFAAIVPQVLDGIHPLLIPIAQLTITGSPL